MVNGKKTISGIDKMTADSESKANPTGKLSEKELCPDALLKGQEAAFENDINRLRTRQDEFVQVACPACGSQDPTFELNKFGFRYDRCNHCRTIFLNPRPTPEIMADYYANSENYRYWKEYIFPASEAARKEKLHQPWLTRVLNFCRQYGIRNGNLMEFGSGFGTFCDLAQACGEFNAVIAVEPTPEMAEACKERGLTVISKRIEEIGSGDVPVPDLIVAFEVIEHLFDPESVLAKCHQLLRPGGLIVLSCPNGMGFDISVLKEKSLAIDVEHVNLFNPESLEMMLQAKGFDVLDISTPGRLDVEFVRDAVHKGEFELPDVDFLKQVVCDDFESLGWAFQEFLSANRLSSHMWVVARKAPADSDEDNKGHNADRAMLEESVRQCYSTWSKDYYKDYYQSDKAYPAVHTQIVRSYLDQPGIKRILDAGCGPASMLRDLSGLDAELFGFDLTPGMVEEARRVMNGLGHPAENIWTGSVLDRNSFCAAGKEGRAKYDAAICVGVLPHIPETAEVALLENLYHAVDNDGLVMIEARNELFALFTMNRYSHDYIAGELIKRGGENPSSAEAAAYLEDITGAMKSHFRMDMPPIRKGKAGEPGYDEIISRTHNPIVMKSKFEKAGFKDVEVLFYHYHCLPPIYEQQHPELFRKLSVEMEDPLDWRGHFMASAFILAGKRA